MSNPKSKYPDPKKIPISKLKIKFLFVFCFWVLEFHSNYKLIKGIQNYNKNKNLVLINLIFVPIFGFFSMVFSWDLVCLDFEFKRN